MSYSSHTASCSKWVSVKGQKVWCYSEFNSPARAEEWFLLSGLLIFAISFRQDFTKCLFLVIVVLRNAQVGKSKLSKWDQTPVRKTKMTVCVPWIRRDRVWFGDWWIRTYGNEWSLMSTKGKPTSVTSSENIAMVQQSNQCVEGESSPRNQVI